MAVWWQPLTGFKFDAPGMCDSNFGVGIGGSGTVNIIDLSWQFAYNAPVKDPRTGCISSKPAGSMLGGNIKIVVRAVLRALLSSQLLQQ